MIRPLAAILLLAVLFVSACEKDKSLLFVQEADKYVTAPVQEDYSRISDPEERWNAYQLDDYAIIQRHSFFGAYPGSFKIFVINDEIQDVLDVQADTLLSFEKPKHLCLLTIEELFNLAETASRGNAAFFEIEYNDRFGYPETIFVNPDSFIVDEEYSYHTSELEKIIEVR